MYARRFRNKSAQRLAEFRWWGCVLLAMFALVQTARGSAAPPELVGSTSAQLPSGINSVRDHSTQYCIASAALGDVNAGDLPIQTP
jgi:hypothetical protein